MTRAPPRPAPALLALGGFAVHQVRYALVPDPHAAVAHGYLAGAPVVLALLLATALGWTLAALGRRGRLPVPGTRPALRWTWLCCAGALLVLHVAQEGAERLVSGGGPIDPGVLLVVPLCLLAGWLVALGLRESAALAGAARSPVVPRARLLAAAVLALPRPAVAARTGVARHLAGRAPPALG